MWTLKCVTWNVHRAKGRDGLVDPERVTHAIESVLSAHEPDVLALQEADGERRPHARIFDVARIAGAAGLVYAHDEPRLRWGAGSDGFLGTILFLNPRLKRVRSDVIDLPGHCHRGAIAVEVESAGRQCRIISTHLSLSQPLRVMQMRTLGQYLRRRPAMQNILLGDLNEWRPWKGTAFSRLVTGTSFRGPARASFPSGRPVLPLDRILTDAGGQVEGMEVIDSPLTTIASDHRPLAATVTVA